MTQNRLKSISKRCKQKNWIEPKKAMPNDRCRWRSPKKDKKTMKRISRWKLMRQSWHLLIWKKQSRKNKISITKPLTRCVRSVCTNLRHSAPITTSTVKYRTRNYMTTVKKWWINTTRFAKNRENSRIAQCRASKTIEWWTNKDSRPETMGIKGRKKIDKTSWRRKIGDIRQKWRLVSAFWKISQLSKHKRQKCESWKNLMLITI